MLNQNRAARAPHACWDAGIRKPRRGSVVIDRGWRGFEEADCFGVSRRLPEVICGSRSIFGERFDLCEPLHHDRAPMFDVTELFAGLFDLLLCLGDGDTEALKLGLD